MTEDHSGMFQVEFTGEIIGGPHDGAVFTWKGQSSRAESLEIVATMELDGHIYTIAAFNPTTKQVTLIF